MSRKGICPLHGQALASGNGAQLFEGEMITVASDSRAEALPLTGLNEDTESGRKANVDPEAGATAPGENVGPA